MAERAQERLQAAIVEIVDGLFVNGAGQRADRLVLTVDGSPSRDLGGWCRAAVASQIYKSLAAVLPVVAQEPGWQPIETAPKRERVLLYRPESIPDSRIAVRRADDWCGPNCCPSAEPKFWMKLPDPPSSPSSGSAHEKNEQ